MKGKYKTDKGQIVEIVEHDTVNRSVMVTINGRGCEWFPEKEIDKWECLEPEEEKEEVPAEIIEEPMVTEEIEEISEPEEKPKRKRTTKKKKQ